MENREQFEQDFFQLVKIVENMQQKISGLEQSNQVLIRSNHQLMEWVQDTVDELEDYKENARFEILDEEQDDSFWYPHVESGEAAIEKIVKDGCSMARFGDGEFAAIAGRVRHKFQTVADEKLGQRLLEVLHAKEDGLLLGIADNYGSLQRYTAQAKREIRRYLKREVRREHLALLERDMLYYDAYVTRPYIMYADNGTDAPLRRFENLKRIWDGRDCVFVEGNQTRLGVGNDLFANAGSVRRILAPVVNAFGSYERIYEECLKQNKDALFLLALGPTATVLAYDLYQAGYQAVDVGHVDLEYEWFLKGEGHRTPVEGKYNNEIAGGEVPADIRDARYDAQVIADFSDEE
ncbi:MAG: GT-D fold domain-containing glycosyltransferase [Roseburia sp.]